MINRLKENFTQVDNSFLNRSDISLKAKGLYAYICSKSDNWQFSYAGLTHQLQEGEKALRSAVKELVDASMLLRIPKKDNNTFVGWDWIINPTKEDLENHIDPSSRDTFKTASSQDGKFPKQEVPKTASSQNGYLISNKDSSKKELSNKDISNKEENLVFFENSDLNSIFIDFKNDRKNRKAPMTDLAVKLLINKVNKWLELYSIEEIIGFFEHAIESGYRSVFEKKQFAKPGKTERKKDYYETEEARNNFTF